MACPGAPARGPGSNHCPLWALEPKGIKPGVAAWLLFPEPSDTHPHLLLNGVFPPCPSFFQASPKFTLKNNIYIYLQFSNSKIASPLRSLVDSPTHPTLRAHAQAAPQAVPRAPCFCRQGLPRPAAVLCPPRPPAHLVSELDAHSQLPQETEPQLHRAQTV